MALRSMVIPLLIHKVSVKRKRKPSNEPKKKIKKMKIQESNLSTTASVPLDCEAECGKTSAPPGRAEKKQKTSHEVKATSQLPCNLGE